MERWNEEDYALLDSLVQTKLEKERELREAGSALGRIKGLLDRLGENPKSIASARDEIRSLVSHGELLAF